MRSMSGNSDENMPNRHPSVKALLALSPGERNPKVVMREAAKKKVGYAKTMSWPGPPYCPKELCSIFGIRCFEVEHDIGGDGRILLGLDGKPRIEYATGRLEVRQRFTIFHEFAHTLFPDYCDFLPCHHGSGERLEKAEKEFEGLCDVGASEMLFPEEDFRADMASIDKLDFAAIASMHERYKASIDATCLRLADLSISIGFSFVFLTDYRGGNKGHGPLWVKYSVRSAAFKSYIPSGAASPAWSSATSCYRDGGTTNPTKETWWVRGQPRSYLVQATRLPEIADPTYPKVLVLLLPLSYKAGPP